VSHAQATCATTTATITSGITARPSEDSSSSVTALALMPLACGAAAVAFWYGSRFYVRDRGAIVSAGTSHAPPARARDEGEGDTP
jgi:hypothetical protein